MRTSEQTDKVLPALFEVKKELRPMVKDSANPFFKSKYLELSDILANLEPILHDKGLFLTQGTLLREGKTIIISRVSHPVSGQFVESEYLAEVANVDPQKLGAAVSYGRRYGLQALFALNVIDDDGNTASGKVVAREEAEKPAARASGFNTRPAAAAEAAPQEPKKEEQSPAAAPARRGSFGSR